MKIKLIIGALSLMILISFPLFTQAYLIEPTIFNSYCVKIDNMKDFSEYYFLIVLWPDSGTDNATLYWLEENKCQPLNPGFYGKRLLYAINKNNIKELGDISAKDFEFSDGSSHNKSIISFQNYQEIGAWRNSDERCNHIESVIYINQVGKKKINEGEFSLTNFNIDESGKIIKIYGEKANAEFYNTLNFKKLFFSTLIAVLIIVVAMGVKKRFTKI